MEIKNLFLSLIKNSQDIIFFKDIKGRLIEVNPAWEQAASKKKNEAIGKTSVEIFGKTVGELLAANDKKVMETKQQIEIEEHIEINGKISYFYSKKFPVLDTNDELIGIGGISTDITSCKKLNNEIKNKEEQLELITDFIAKHKEKLKAITGLLPVCSSCKKVRDSGGRWHDIDYYISHHSSAECSHSICPECASELYPELKLSSSASPDTLKN